MIIKSTDLAFASRHAFFKHHTENEHLKNLGGHRRPGADNTHIDSDKTVSAIDGARSINAPFKVSLSDEALKKRTSIDSDAPGNMQAAKSANNLPEDKFDPKTQLIKSMIEMMSGKKISQMDISNIDASSEKTQELVREQSITQSEAGKEYQYHEVYHESEQFNFSASGVIKTTDGQTFNFNLDVQISRDFYQETNISMASGYDQTRKDPLVLNFNGLASELSDMLFDFKLDLLDPKDKPGLPATGRGLLVIDKEKQNIQDNTQDQVNTSDNLTNKDGTTEDIGLVDLKT